MSSRLRPSRGRRLTFVMRMSGMRSQPSARMVPPLRGNALIVPAEGAHAARRRRVGDDGHEVRAVAEAALELVRGQEARPRVRGLGAEDAVQLSGVAAALVDLQVEL